MDDSPLNELSGELRNRIYEYATVEDEPIDIASQEPPLLAVCRQIRAEARPIYFHQEFAVEVSDHDTAPTIKWLKAKNRSTTFDHIKTLTISYQPITTIELAPTSGEESIYLKWKDLCAALRDVGLHKKPAKGSKSASLRVEFKRAWVEDKYSRLMRTLVGDGWGNVEDGVSILVSVMMSTLLLYPEVVENERAAWKTTEGGDEQ